MTLGKFLKMKRLKMGLYMKDFGINHAAISRFESGVCSPTFKSLQKISKTYKIKVWQLIKEFEK